MAGDMLPKNMVAEFLGTFLLVFLAVGTAVFGISALVGADGAGPGSGGSSSGGRGVTLGSLLLPVLQAATVSAMAMSATVPYRFIQQGVGRG